MDIQEKIIRAGKLLDELDEFYDSLPTLLSICDSKIDDLLHLIENQKLNTAQCYRVIRELHNLRTERRQIKNDSELMRTYNTEKNKLLNKDYRPFLLSNIGKTIKIQNARQYACKIYAEEEIKELLGE